MATVELRFTPLAEHVRTARLVAVSVARRAGFAEVQLDEIRIAIGEACARAVGQDGVEALGGGVALVDMRLCDDDDRLDVTVVQCGPDGLPLSSPAGTAAAADPLSLALLQGMADSSDTSAPTGGVVLSWRRQPVEVPAH